MILTFTLIPIIVMSAVLFYNREQDVIEESHSYMEYKMERDAAQLSTGIDSLNMSARFFGSDEELLSFLRNASDGIVPDARSLVDFYDTKIAELERMVNNNPLLYSVRVYSVGEVQEMMPILYSKSRMSKLSWAGGEDVTGWHFGYNDTLFSSLTTKQENKLAALVTEVSDYSRGTIGYIEAVMPMETLFPSLYEGFGLPPLEALARGTPVLAADNSSIPEVLSPAATLITHRFPFAQAQEAYNLFAAGKAGKALLVY